MPNWQSLSTLKSKSKTNGRAAKKSEKQQKRFSHRHLRLEPFEERVLFAIGPQLIAVIPNEGQIIQDGNVLHVAPRDLTFRFDDGQTIDPATVSAITITRGGADRDVTTLADNVVVTTGFVGIGDNPNEVVARFDNTLPDDQYRITIAGTLKNTNGDAFNGGVNQTVRTFKLDLGAQVVSVVPQPISRDSLGKLQQGVNEIDVYFNHDALNQQRANNPAFYQLIRTNNTDTNVDDTLLHPATVLYSAAQDMAVLTFAPGVLTTAGTYRLRIGNNDQVSAPVNVTVSGDPGSTFATAGPSPSQDLGSVFSGSQGLQSLILSSSIDSTNDPTPNTLTFPGGITEPGMRDIPIPSEHHIYGSADTTDGIPVIYYNFKPNYGTVAGVPLFNIITEQQK